MSIKQQIKETLWDLLEQYYNVDRKLPSILISKNPTSNNIDKVGDKLGDIVEQIIVSLYKDIVKEEKQEEKPKTKQASTEFDEDEFMEKCNWEDDYVATHHVPKHGDDYYDPDEDDDSDDI